ncbi:MAG: hypothetical protein PHW00_03230 [Clostridia bacterium]|nr:hypothetical protein [Clostridia bacterium]
MKKSIIAIISIALVLAVGLSVIGVGSQGFSNWDTNTWFNKESESEETTEAIDTFGDVEFTPSNSNFVSLSVSRPLAMAAASGYSKSVSLTATVLPLDVPDKSVDWYIAWSDESVTATLSDYATVTPTSDGSLTATVTCYQSFNDDIVVTVVTRVGGMSASCLVTYVGAPESVSIVGNGVSTTAHSGIGSYYALPTGGSYTFDLSVDNGFGDVRTACNYTYTVSAEGNIITQDRKYNGTTGVNTYVDGTQETLAIKDITKVTSYISNAYECSLSGTTLTITSNATLTGYYSSSTRTGQMVTYYDSFTSFENDNWYYYVTVTETNSGASQTIKFRPIASVASVSLSQVTIGM